MAIKLTQQFFTKEYFKLNIFTAEKLDLLFMLTVFSVDLVFKEKLNLMLKVLWLLVKVQLIELGGKYLDLQIIRTS